jgi:predicted phage-related endonuclease
LLVDQSELDGKETDVIFTAEQRAFRDQGIGGSDARTVMYGDGKSWADLVAEKKQSIQPRFPRSTRRLMDLGHAIEPLTLAWFAEDYEALRQTDFQMSWDLEPLFRVTLDGITVSGQPVQAKFHSGDRRIEELADHYTPQLQHEMLVTDAGRIWLAVTFGRYGQFRAIEVERDEGYLDTYKGRALQFRHFWNTGELPADMTPPAKPAASIRQLRDHVWPASDNLIGVLAGRWLEVKAAADGLDAAARELKAQFPDDARSAKWIADGRGIAMKRNRSGVVSLSAL